MKNFNKHSESTAITAESDELSVVDNNLHVSKISDANKPPYCNVGQNPDMRKHNADHLEILDFKIEVADHEDIVVSTVDSANIEQSERDNQLQNDGVGTVPKHAENNLNANIVCNVKKEPQDNHDEFSVEINPFYENVNETNSSCQENLV